MASQPPLLNFKCLHETTPGIPLILIHGLFGAAENLMGIGRAFPQRPVLSVDLRNHGRSFHAPTMSFREMAADVYAVIEAQGWQQVDVIGHSLGGKVAIQLAKTWPELVRRLVVADIAPVEYPPGHQSILEGLQAIDPAQISGRKQADELLQAYVSEPGVRGFLLMNLVREDNGLYAWRFNLQGLSANYNQLRSSPDGESAYTGQTLYIRGGNSSYILDKNRDVIARHTPNYQITTLAGCGHWLHAEKPAEFNALVTDFLEAS